MNADRLVWRLTWSRPLRSCLTILAIAVAVFLICLLRSIITSLDSAVTASASNRIVVGSAVSLFQALPIAYRARIEEMPGVESVCSYTWFGGRYQSPKNFFAQFATDPEAMLDMYPEVSLPDEQRQAFVEDRQGCIVGEALAAKFDFKVGQQIPLMGTIYRRIDGSTWDFTCRGIYQAHKANVDDQTLFFHWSTLDEVLERGDAEGPRGTSVLMVHVARDHTPESVGSAIDSYYAGGPQRTRTQPEAAFQASFVGMLGNLPVFLGTIGGAVLIALLFGIVNTMTMAARERTRTVGILSSLGFPARVPARLYIVEALLLAALGAALGMGLAYLTQAPLRRLLGTQIPMYAVAPTNYVLAGLVALGAGLLGGGVPALQAMRLRPVDALRRGS